MPREPRLVEQHRRGHGQPAEQVSAMERDSIEHGLHHLGKWARWEVGSAPPKRHSFSWRGAPLSRPEF